MPPAHRAGPIKLASAVDDLKSQGWNFIKNKLPVVGLFTGAQLLYSPLKHYVMNVRASYYDETREQVENLWNVLKMHKIGIIYQDDAFGSAVLDGLQLALIARMSAWAPSSF